MKKLIWFTHTNVDTRKIHRNIFDSNYPPNFSIDLTKYIKIFKKNEIWKKTKYRTEYKDDYNEEDFNKIKSIKILFYSESAPYSNGHSYEKVLKNHFNYDSIELSKITSSSIGEATQISVIETIYESNEKIIDNLSHHEEKDIDIIFEKKLSNENIDSWNELNRIKSIIVEFIQFANFNLHLNFLSTSYSFSFTEKPLQTGFTVQTDQTNFYYETDKIDFLGHYLLYDSNIDNLTELMDTTVNIWHKNIPTIYFFLDALRGTHITINNFSKLVFTLESFFSERTSNDFMTLTIPLLLGENIQEMKMLRSILTKAFSIRNNYVHGKEILTLRSEISNKDNSRIDKIFFELKNIIIKILHFYMANDLYLLPINQKINHELIFMKLPKGIKS